jgi:hypothetical protein
MGNCMMFSASPSVLMNVIGVSTVYQDQDCAAAVANYMGKCCRGHLWLALMFGCRRRHRLLQHVRGPPVSELELLAACGTGGLPGRWKSLGLFRFDGS